MRTCLSTVTAFRSRPKVRDRMPAAARPGERKASEALAAGEMLMVLYSNTQGLSSDPVVRQAHHRPNGSIRGGKMQAPPGSVYAARQVIHRYLPPTPLFYSPRLSRRLGCEVHVKCENLSPIRSFK